MRDTLEIQMSHLGKDLAPMRQLRMGIERDLAGIGVSRVTDLRGQVPEQLCRAYCSRSRRQPDDVLLDVFTALVAFADTGEALPWWQFTRQRTMAAHHRPLRRVGARRIGTDGL
jgi:hypothetical protein